VGGGFCCGCGKVAGAQRGCVDRGVGLVGWGVTIIVPGSTPLPCLEEGFVQFIFGVMGQLGGGGGGRSGNGGKMCGVWGGRGVWVAQQTKRKGKRLGEGCGVWYALLGVGGLVWGVRPDKCMS